MLIAVIKRANEVDSHRWIDPKNGRGKMALRLERWLGADHGCRASVWLGMQAAYDLWQT